MKNLYIIIILLVLITAKNGYTQCSNYTYNYPLVTASTTSNSLTTVNLCMNGENYTYFNITAGETNTVHTLGVDEAGVKTILNRAELVEDIISINYKDNGVFQLDCIGGTKFDIVKPIFIEIVTEIYKVEEKSYIQ